MQKYVSAEFRDSDISEQAMLKLLPEDTLRRP